MAKSYTGLKKQHDKVRTVFEGLTPPAPDDEYEDLRRSVYREMDKMDQYLTGRVTGDGSVHMPISEE